MRVTGSALSDSPYPLQAGVPCASVGQSRLLEQLLYGRAGGGEFHFFFSGRE